VTLTSTRILIRARGGGRHSLLVYAEGLLRPTLLFCACFPYASNVNGRCVPRRQAG
jgi:hypothetical protein